MHNQKAINVCVNCIHAAHCLLPKGSISYPLYQTFQFQSKSLKPGEFLARQGQLKNDLYILRAGVLKSFTNLRNGEEWVMGFYFPPDLLGWEYIQEVHTSISIMALDPSNICIIPIDKLTILMQTITHFSAQLMQLISKRIDQDNVALLRTTAAQRVATFLLQIAYRYEQAGFPRHICYTAMTHQDIANYLRLNASTLSRLLHNWEKKKIIRLYKNRIELLDSGYMHMIAGD